VNVGIVYPIPFGTEGVFGGAERYVSGLARELSRTEATTLVTIGPRRVSERAGRLRIETHPFLALVRGVRHNPFALGFLKSLAGVDIIHCHGYSTLSTDLSVLFARLTRKKVFITDHGGGADVSLTRWANVADLADGLLMVSEFASRSFGASRTARTIVYGGVDVERFSPGPRRVGGGTVLFVGRLLPHKGVNYLIEAMDPHTPLRIVGQPYDRRYHEHLRQLADGKNVTFVSGAGDDDLVNEYRSSSLVVLPSVYEDIYGHRSPRPELLGLAALEAMACGVPVLCTSVGGLPEVVEDGRTGFVVPPNDAGALAARIALVREQPDRLRRMGERARARVLDRFTWARVAQRCLTAYAATALPVAAAV
jgi:glycosyltransferase involved in cell wall biosynthesis